MADNRFKLAERYNFNSVYGKYNAVVDYARPQSSTGDWNIVEGEIIYVSPEDHTCVVQTEDGRNLYNVASLSPWFSFSTGCGMYFYPEAKSRVVLGKSYTGQWYILGYAPLKNVSDPAPMLNGKRDIKEGDATISTAFGNFIEVRKTAGSIAIHNTETCEIILDSKENQIFIRSQRLYILNSAGSIEMTTDTNGNTVTVGYFRQKLNDNANFVKVMMGSVGLAGGAYTVNADGTKSNPPLIFSINICNKASLTVDTAGNVISYCKSHEQRVEEDSTLIANGIIRDRSATDIRHERIKRSKLSGVVDPELANLSGYAPKVSPIPPAGDMSQISPAQSGAMPAGPNPTDIGDPSPPEKDGRLVARVSDTYQDAKSGGTVHEGTLTVYGDNNAVLGTYKFISGPFGSGPMKTGSYKTTAPSDTSEEGIMVYEESTGATCGWKAPLSNGMSIHSDGAIPGTAGSVGVVGGIAMLEECKNNIKTAVELAGGNCTLEYYGPRDPNSVYDMGYDDKRYGRLYDVIKRFSDSNSSYVYSSGHTPVDGYASQTDCSGFIGQVIQKVSDESGEAPVFPKNSWYPNSSGFKSSKYTTPISSNLPSKDNTYGAQPGDIMQFGANKNGVRHVAMFMGFNEKGEPLIAHSTAARLRAGTGAVEGNVGTTGVRIEPMPSRYAGRYEGIYRVNNMDVMLDKLEGKS